MGSLMKGLMGGDDEKDTYSATIAEQEHRKKLAEESARSKAVSENRANALAQAEADKRKKAFLAKTTTTSGDEDQLGGSKNLLG